MHPDTIFIRGWTEACSGYCIPRGGYVHHAEKEAAPVAEYLNSIGLHAFVLKEQREEFIKTYSCDELVRTDMPPVFVWHAVDDERVKVGACISFVKRMTEMKNDIECHLFPSGGHGKGVVEAVQIEGLSQWLDLFENWLKRKGFC